MTCRSGCCTAGGGGGCRSTNVRGDPGSSKLVRGDMDTLRGVLSTRLSAPVTSPTPPRLTCDIRGAVAAPVLVGYNTSFITNKSSIHILSSLKHTPSLLLLPLSKELFMSSDDHRECKFDNFDFDSSARVWPPDNINPKLSRACRDTTNSCADLDRLTAGPSVSFIGDLLLVPSKTSSVESTFKMKGSFCFREYKCCAELRT